MRAIEFLQESEVVQEIERLDPTDYQGGKNSLSDMQTGKQVNPLPGGSGLLYSIGPGRHNHYAIKLWDPKGPEFVKGYPKPIRKPDEDKWEYQDRIYRWEALQAAKNKKMPGQLIGELTLDSASYFPLKDAVKVDTITIDEDYRGLSLAKALYGIVLTIMKRPLLAGELQTPGGRKNWVSLNQIPGVEMKGYMVLKSNDFTDETIDTIMGELGGQYIGKHNIAEKEYFAFDVQPNTTNQELEAYVKTRINKVYSDSYRDITTGLYAVWEGQ